jgi:hypothetical protein
LGRRPRRRPFGLSGRHPQRIDDAEVRLPARVCLRGRGNVFAEQVERREEALPVEPPDRVQGLVEPLAGDEAARRAAQYGMPQRRFAEPPRSGKREKKGPERP